MLAGMGMDEKELVDLMLALGDPSGRATLAQRVRRWGRATTALPGEMVAFLTLVGRVREAGEGLRDVLLLPQRS